MADPSPPEAPPMPSSAAHAAVATWVRHGEREREGGAQDRGAAPGEPTSVIQHKGSSVNKSRQSEPHAHSINLDAAGRKINLRCGGTWCGSAR